MDNSQNQNKNRNQIKYKEIRTSSSQVNIRPKYKQDGLVFLINTLNKDIKVFFQSVKQCLIESKINNSKLSPFEILQLIEQYLNEFIDKAKDTFKKMKYTQKINILQQAIDDYQTNNNKNLNLNLKDEMLMNNRNKILVDEVYMPSLCNNTSSSLMVNNYFDDNININTNLDHNLNNINQNFKKINNYSYNKIKNNNNINIRKNSNDIFQNYNNKYNNNYNYNYIKQLNDVKNKNKNKNTKDENDIRKKILVNKIQVNNSNNSNNNSNSNNKSAPKVHYYSNNQTLNNIYSPKKEILNNLNRIITLLKEIKSINGNVFTKTCEAQEHQKLSSKLYYELNNLVNNIFKEKSIKFDNENDNDNYNNDYLSGNISEASLKEKKIK